mgnify:CR=1 FL=1
MAMSHIIVLKNLDQNQERERVWWARENCSSFGAWYVYEDSDNHMDKDEWHTEFKFIFSKEQDAVIFQLRWQGQNNE